MPKFTPIFFLVVSSVADIMPSLIRGAIHCVQLVFLMFRTVTLA